MSAEYEMRFTGDSLDVRVGDKISFAGIGTVSEIRGDLVDITSWGSDPEFTLGGVTIALVANAAKVAKS